MAYIITGDSLKVCENGWFILPVLSLMFAIVWDISDTTFQEVALLLSSSDGLLLYWPNLFTALF